MTNLRTPDEEKARLRMEARELYWFWRNLPGRTAPTAEQLAPYLGTGWAEWVCHRAGKRMDGGE